MAKLGLQGLNNNAYTYLESTAGKSAAVGMVDATGNIVVVPSLTTGATPAGTYVMQIENAANGNVNITPNGSGSVILSKLQVTGQATMSASQVANYVTTATTPYVVLTTDYFISMDSTGGAKTVQLPNVPTTGRVFVIKDHAGTAGTNAITVTTVGGVVNIDGATTFVMNTNNQAISLIFNGLSYEIF